MLQSWALLSNVNAKPLVWCFNQRMTFNSQLQGVYDEFHMASVELKKCLESAPHSDSVEPLRQRVENLRGRLIDLAFDDADLGPDKQPTAPL